MMSSPHIARQLRDATREWNLQGDNDPLYAVLAHADKKGNGWDMADFLATGDSEINRLYSRLASLDIAPKWGRALDFGCGVGRLTKALSKQYGHVDGVDVSEQMLMRARTANPINCTYHLSASSKLPFPDNRFDLVYSSIALQHTGSLAEGYILEFARVLTPGGILHFQLPTRPKLSAAGLAIRLIPDTILNAKRGWKMHGINQTKTEALLKRAGLRVLDISADESAGPHWESRRYTAIRLDN